MLYSRNLYNSNNNDPVLWNVYTVYTRPDTRYTILP